MLARRKSNPSVVPPVTPRLPDDLPPQQRALINRELLKSAFSPERWNQQMSRWAIFRRALRVPLMCVFLFPLLTVPLVYLIPGTIIAPLVTSAVATVTIYILWTALSCWAYSLCSPPSAALNQHTFITTGSGGCCRSATTTSKSVLSLFPVTLTWNRWRNTGTMYCPPIDELGLGLNDEEVDILDKYNTQAAEYIANAHVSIEFSDIRDIEKLYHTIWSAFEDESLAPSTTPHSNGKTLQSFEIDV
jgi:hypothetical protein